ncbi:MAG: hypothetical protein A3F10_04785 [Coxiella sp. RIFCSPHIGHO2_12_FULL_42_15]|nr:MAG: hypothetical protein A3F10_04785 [Coxiella sp. RIFCSPHIGHO2_12_FULL_42_15]
MVVEVIIVITTGGVNAIAIGEADIAYAGNDIAAMFATTIIEMTIIGTVGNLARRAVLPG